MYGKKVTTKSREILPYLIACARVALLASLGFTTIPHGQAQNDSPADDPVVSLFPHSQTSRYWISGQDNIIFQWHPSFDASYSGRNSLRSTAEHATSNVATFFLGYQLGQTTEVFADVEAAAGGGLSDALGLAGFVNVDVVRNPQLGPSPYLARAMVRQIIPLSSETVEGERGPFALATSLPVRRLEVRAGKFGMADFFDLNDSGSDSHSQFMNWTVDNNGAYDYAADTRGYTVGIIAEYHDRNWAFRFGESLMPKVANGPDLDWNLRRARAENYELEIRPGLIRGSGDNAAPVVVCQPRQHGCLPASHQRFPGGQDATAGNPRSRSPNHHRSTASASIWSRSWLTRCARLRALGME